MNTAAVTFVRTEPPLRWILPLAVGLAGIAYQIALGESHTPTPWTHLEFTADMVLFGLVNPVLAFVGYSAFCRAAAERAEAKRRAERAEGMLAALDEISPDAIVVLDARGRIVRWNSGAQALLGHSATEVLGRPFADLLDGPGGVGAEWRSFRHLVGRHGAARRFQSRVRGRTGEALVVEASGKELRDAEGLPTGLVAVFRDMAERPEMADGAQTRLSGKVAELARANDELQRMVHARDEVLSLVAHEVRLPLANVLAGTERLQVGCGEPLPTCSRMVGVIRQQVGRLDALLRGVLDATQMESGAWTLCREYTTIEAIVREAVTLSLGGSDARTIGISVPEGGSAVVDADRDRIVQVLCNLLSNAAKYSPPGSPIGIESETGPEWVTVRVRDHGSGLSGDCLERVFGKFIRVGDTTAADGHGLGLYICRQIVSAHGGRIWAENHPEGGTRFCFTLPIAR